jgi:hypothetical protein
MQIAGRRLQNGFCPTLCILQLGGAGATVRVDEWRSGVPSVWCGVVGGLPSGVMHGVGGYRPVRGREAWCLAE